MRGFTLLEMLFVMFIISLMFGLVAPRFGAGLDRYELLSQRKDIEDQLRQLPRRVRLSARPLELPGDIKLADLGDGAPPLLVPPGWQLSFTPPMLISRNGACSASVAELIASENIEASARYQVTELTCELVPLAS